MTAELHVRRTRARTFRSAVRSAFSCRRPRRCREPGERRTPPRSPTPTTTTRRASSVYTRSCVMIADEPIDANPSAIETTARQTITTRYYLRVVDRRDGSIATRQTFPKSLYPTPNRFSDRPMYTNRHCLSFVCGMGGG